MKSEKIEQANIQPIDLIKIPDPKPLTEIEKNKILAECKNWYAGYIANTGFNGEILVAKAGNIVYEQYDGFVNLDSNAKNRINENTSFHIASVSKTFTAMAVLKLWEDGKLNIDDEFSKYFRGFNYAGVTIRTLLNHRSGLPNYLYFMEKFWLDKTKMISNQDVLNYLIQHKNKIEDISPPNTHFSYCNTNYALLALLIEKITGIGYQQYLNNTIFAPLQMKNTYVYMPSDSNTCTPNYDWKGRKNKMTFLDNVYGDKNIYSNVRDLLRWDRALSLHIFLKENTLKQAYEPYSNEKPGIKNYGLGWRMNIYPNNKKMIFHNGWWHGNTSAFIRLTDEDATIIALSNKHSKSAYKAKILSNIFYPYFDVNEEEDLESSDSTNISNIKKLDSLKAKSNSKPLIP